MNTTITSAKQIPDAKFYVLTNDRFFSDWFGNGKTNTIILPCDSMEQVITIMKHAKSRKDQYNVRCVFNKPRIREGRIYSLYSMESAPTWYGKED